MRFTEGANGYNIFVHNSTKMFPQNN